MQALDCLKELAALGGYNITNTDTQAVANKARALRRLNIIRADVASRFSGRWQGLYREGWLALTPVYGDGTVAITQGSNTVTGTSTTWTAAMVGRQFLGPDNAYYKIASIVSSTSLLLTVPYQGATVSVGVYQIWQDEYALYPEAFSVIDFINYSDPLQMAEGGQKQSRHSYPRATAVDVPRVYTILARDAVVGSYSTGTLSGTVDTLTLTGSGTAWLANLQPGYEIKVGSYTYTVRKVNSDTEVELYQYIVSTITAATSYTAKGRNALKVRFSYPVSQQIVSYAYFAKPYPIVNDIDEDWILNLYIHVILEGAMKYDFLDKNDPVRASAATQLFENSVSNAHTSDQSQFSGTATVGLDIPDHARE